MNSINQSANNVKRTHYGFSQVPRIAIRGNHKLSMAGLGLYTALKDICGDEGECYYSLRNLAQVLGWDKCTISRHIPELVGAGLITAEKKPNRRGPENWHIRIVDIWKENDDLYRPADLSQKQDNHLYQNETTLYQNETTNSKSTRRLYQNDTKEEEKENVKKEKGSPPPLTFPSEKTLPSAQLLPSEQSKDVSTRFRLVTSSDVPPDVQAVIDNWAAVLGLPAIHADKKIQEAAEKLAPYNLSVADLKSIKQFCLDDNPGWFRDKLRGKVTLPDILKNVAGWKSAQQTREQRPPHTNVGVSGKPKIDTTSDDYREFMKAMGGD